MRYGSKAIMAALALAGLVAAGCGSSSKTTSPTTVASTPTTGGAVTTPATTPATTGNQASAPGVTADSIKIGFITSITGNASSTFADAAAGAKAYFDAVNKAGGVSGRKIQMVSVDDLSTPAGDQTAFQDLIHQNVFAILNFSPYAFGGYRAAVQAGIPVTGGGFDGPEWGQKPNTNMFTTTGGTNGRTSNNTGEANFYKFIGVTNVGALAYGISPSSTGSVQDLKTALEKIGLKMGYENLSVPFGGVDVTSYILAMKAAAVDGAACSCVQSTTIALFTGLAQGGVKAKALSFASADSSLFTDSTAAAAAQGAYYVSQIPPIDTNNSATNTMLANLKASDPGYKGGYPTFGVTGAYLAAALTVKGLQVAGPNPTRKSFIANLTQVTNYTADGLLGGPVSFNHFGTSEPSRCSWYVQVAGNTFKSINGGKVICGTSF